MPHRIILSVLGFVIFFSPGLSAQTVDFNAVVTPTDMRARDFEEYLVQLAWQNHPANRVLEYEKNIADLQLKATKQEYLEQSGITFNLNQANLKQIFPDLPIAEPDIPTFFPFWNVTAAFNLGLLTTRKQDIAIAKEHIKISEAEINEQKLKIRLEILTLYREYLASLEVYKSRANAFESAATIRDYMRIQFEKNAVEFDEYSKAEEAFYRAEESRILAEQDISLKKLMIEAMTGVKWEIIERYKALYEKK